MNARTGEINGITVELPEVLGAQEHIGRTDGFGVGPTIVQLAARARYTPRSTAWPEHAQRPATRQDAAYDYTAHIHDNIGHNED